MRLRSDIFVAAYIRRRNAENAYAVVSHKGAAEAGAVFVRIDKLNGEVALYGPAPQMAFDEANPERRFQKISKAESTGADIEAKIRSELRFDPDIWVVDVEDRSGESGLDLIYI